MQDAEQSLTVIKYQGVHTRLILRHVLNRRCLSLVHVLVDVTWMLLFYTPGVASSWLRNLEVYCTCECSSHLWYHNHSCGMRAVENSHDVVQKLRRSQLGVLEVRRESRLFSYQFWSLICYETIVLWGSTLVMAKTSTHRVRMSYLYTNLWTDGACCRCEDVLNIRSSHPQAMDIVRTMSERGRQILFIVSIGPRIVRDVVLIPCVLHDRIQQGREF
jgi:hypothetical protein